MAFLNARVAFGAGSAAVVIEAAAFGIAGVVIALVASRAAWRRRGRGRAPKPSSGRDATPPASPPPVTDDDPLANYRRWKLR